MIRQNIICIFAKPRMHTNKKQNNSKRLEQQVDKHTTSMRWTQVIARMSCAERG